MTSEESLAFLTTLRQDAPDVAKLALSAAAGAFKLRPAFLKRQPRERQAEWMRRALGRNVGAAIAEEVLATYFMDAHQELLQELLDGLGVEHEEGRLMHEDPECPAKKKLGAAIAKFRGGDDPQTRELLLSAFAAQSAINWPDLEELLAGDGKPDSK